MKLKEQIKLMQEEIEKLKKAHQRDILFLHNRIASIDKHLVYPSKFEAYKDNTKIKKKSVKRILDND